MVCETYREIKLYSSKFVRSCDRHSPQAIKVPDTGVINDDD